MGNIKGDGQMDFSANKPIYLQIMDEIKRRIVNGEYKPGDKIPSVREFALSLGVNPNTVQRALSELERDSFVESERTIGRFITRDEGIIEELKEDVIRSKIEQFVEDIESYDYDVEKKLMMLRERLYDGKAD